MTPTIPGLTDLESVTLTANGSITAASTQCSAQSCVWIVVPVDYQSLSVKLSGGFSATLQFEVSWDGIVWASAQAVTGETSATGNGTWYFNLNRAPSFRVRASSYSSGPAMVDIAARIPGYFGPEVPFTAWTGNQDAAGHDLLNARNINGQQVNVNSPAGSMRWSLGTDGLAETGSNAGSNFRLTRYSDAGVSLGSPISIVRSNGAVTILGSFNVDNGGTGAVATQYLQNNSARWSAGKNATAEGGSNAGSDYTINRFNDAGTSLGAALTITRSTGNALFSGQLQCQGRFYCVSPATVIADAGPNAMVFLTNAAAVSRWGFGKNPTAESTGNVGSDFIVNRYSDAGSLLGSPLLITRSSGLITFDATAGGGFAIQNLPTTAPAAGSKQIWVDTSAGNVLKLAV